jgi:phosphoenolpyruvate phosphomutase
MKKTSQLKTLIQSSSLEFILEAHNGLSAKIVEEAGFPGIWASGLSISAALGVRDSNEASWTQVMEVVEFMSDCTTVPILVDADTGYGNFNNVRRLVRKLEQRDVAGMCIEDQVYPKSNSLLKGRQYELADIVEYCGKIEAAKDTQHDPDFCVVARTEAFIAGLGLEEALRRAECYFLSGADAILIHSKKSTFDEIKSFMDCWSFPCPVVIVPTKYFATPTTDFEQSGVSLAIWANHLLRTNIKFMQNTASRIMREKSLMGVEGTIAPVEEVFRLQDIDELNRAEEHYLINRLSEASSQ